MLCKGFLQPCQEKAHWQYESSLPGLILIMQMHFMKNLYESSEKKKKKQYRNGSLESSYLNYWCDKGNILWETLPRAWFRAFSRKEMVT